MKLKNFFSKTPVKVISAILLFLIFTGAISFAVIRPFEKIFSNENAYTMAFLGASETEWGINPAIIDERLGEKSYLLATSGCTLDGRYEMLLSALEQDSLETVVLDVGYFALRKEMSNFDLEKRVLYFSRISGLDGKLKEAGKNFSFWDDEYDKLYAEMIFEGTNAWKKIVRGRYPEYESHRGYDPQGNTSQLLTPEEARATYNQETLNTDFRERNIARLRDIIEVCKEKGVKVYVITIPVSRQYIWQNDGWDDFHDIMLEITSEYDLEYTDFNLLKDFSSYLPEDTAFRDYEHLCDEGVTSFSNMLSDFLAESEKSPGRNPEGYKFYASYAEAKENCIYAPYIS